MEVEDRRGDPSLAAVAVASAATASATPPEYRKAFECVFKWVVFYWCCIRHLVLIFSPLWMKAARKLFVAAERGGERENTRRLFTGGHSARIALSRIAALLSYFAQLTELCVEWIVVEGAPDGGGNGAFCPRGYQKTCRRAGGAASFALREVRGNYVRAGLSSLHGAPPLRSITLTRLVVAAD